MISHQRKFRSNARSHAMAKHLINKGHKVTLFVTANMSRLRILQSNWEGVDIIETPDLLWGKLRSGWDLWSLISRMIYFYLHDKPYDLVHCFETRPATIYPALFYCRRNQVPLITDWNDWWGRGGLIDELRPYFYRIFFGRLETYYEEKFRTLGAGLTVISTALARRAEDLGVPRERICYIPGGTFPDFFCVRSKEECRRQVGLQLSAPILGFSSLDSHLDLEMMMQVLSIVAKKYPEVKLIITGKPGKSVRNLAKKYYLSNNVYFTGFLRFEELSTYLSCADLFILPFPNKIYNVGRWPNKIGEYISLGRPTISNPVGDIKKLFETYNIGLLANWDPDDFADKIIYLIENPSIANQLGENARQVAVHRYNWSILINRLEEFYYNILERDRR